MDLQTQYRQYPAISSFIYVGIQKKSPYHLFIFNAPNKRFFIEHGRKKYKALLRMWHKNGEIPKGFIPSSWNIDFLNQAA